MSGSYLARLTDDLEAISSHYAQRHGIHRDSSWFLLKVHEELGELTQAYLMRTGQARDKGHTPAELDQAFRSELADVLCQLLLLARHHDVDLQAEINHKWMPHHPAREPSQP
ncbi:pyrophosphatase [Nonomuraea sp. NPDC050328]|uniref:pyrophosphatase n=1 Tax=Nonomuraea sp. NPDC050328 TaxID=3364361 RepID=UPI0037A27721